jgi:glycosyltransferase involved in cell wall biosynthesis
VLPDRSPARMKIYFDHQTFSNSGYSGISRYFVELIAELNKYPDVEARVVSPLMRSPFLVEARHRIPVVGCDVSKGEHFPSRFVGSINASLFRAIAAIAKPEIVHETFYSRARTAPRSAKIVTTIHDLIPQRFPEIFSRSKSYAALMRHVLRRADRAICVSESTRKDLLEMYDIDPDRVSVVRLASALSLATDGPDQIETPYFLHVGARYPYKNFDGLIRAFGDARLYRTHKLVTFSSQPLTAEELTAVDRAGVPRSSVVAAGGDDHMLARFYAGAEALVFPSLYEGFGIPLVEAMHSGCPIATSNTSSMPEVAGDAAIYFDPRDVKSISEAMIRIASSSPDTRSLLIANGKERSKEFSWQRCAAETYRIYSGLIC